MVTSLRHKLRHNLQARVCLASQLHHITLCICTRSHTFYPYCNTATNYTTY